MKKIYLFLMAFVVATVTMAKPVNIGRASDVASRFFPGVDLRVTEVEHIYLFSPVEGQGFVLVAADDCVRPVLAYSYTGSFIFDNMPEHIRQWLKGYERDIAYRIASGEEASPEVAAEWQRWSEGNPKSSGNQVDPLMTTTWSQYPYYNAWCPYDTVVNDNVKVGCSAVAMGQVMKYWNHPATGMGSNTYTSVAVMDGNTYVYGPLSADFGATTYDWEHMTNNLTSASDSVAINAVAQLLYHAGVSIEMMYSYYGSGAYTNSFDDIEEPTVENALKYNFKYSQSLTSFLKGDYNNSQWTEIIRNEMDEERPVIYAGYGSVGGHAFVIDGYDSLGFFHINWGWNGECNGFFLIDSLAPTRNSGAVMDFSSDASAIVGIRPMDSVSLTSPVVINMISNDTAQGIVTGSGTYEPTDTVRIVACATEGHRFVRWSSGSLSNPRSFLALENLSDTAIFEPLQGDTLAYCHNGMISSWRFSETSGTNWGIRLPSSAIAPHKKLTSVQLYVNYPSLYELRVYLGDSISDATLAYTQAFDIQDVDNFSQWRTLVLNSPVIIPDRTTLWVTFHVEDCSNIYPAAFGTYSGNNDGVWYKNNDSIWVTRTDNSRSWLIRAIMSNVEQVHLAVSPNDINLGDVYGGGFYWPGTNVVLNALPKNGSRFSYWSNGSTDNPLYFIITCDTAFVAFFESVDGISDVESDGLAFTLDGRTLTVTLPSHIPSAELYDVQGRELASFHSPLFTFHFSAPGVYLLKSFGLPARKIVVTR